MISNLLKIIQELRNRGCPDPIAHMRKECDCEANLVSQPTSRYGCGSSCGCGDSCKCVGECTCDKPQHFKLRHPSGH